MGRRWPAIVEPDKKRRPADARVRVRHGGSPGRWPRASTRPRWPVDAWPLSMDANVFGHPLTRRRGRAGWGSDRRRDRRDAGESLRSANHRIERGPLVSARTKSKLRNPLNPAVQAGFRRTASRRAEPQPSLSQARRGPAAKRSTSTKSTVMTTRPARRVLMACEDPATSRRMTAWTHGR